MRGGRRGKCVPLEHACAPLRLVRNAVSGSGVYDVQTIERWGHEADEEMILRCGLLALRRPSSVPRRRCIVLDLLSTLLSVPLSAEQSAVPAAARGAWPLSRNDHVDCASVHVYDDERQSRAG